MLISSNSNDHPNIPAPNILMERYLLHLRMNNWAVTTIKLISGALNRFISWCDQRGISCVTEITPDATQAYRRSLFHHRNARTGKPIKFATQASYLSAVCNWLVWLSDEGWIDSNPAQRIELPKEEQRLPASFLTIGEVESVLNSVDLNRPVGLRDRAILETFYSTGIRRAELIALRTDDINRDSQVITIRKGKGGKSRTVPVGQRALQWIEKYCSDVRPGLLTEPTSTLFLTTRGNSFHPNNLSALVRRHFVAAGITKPGSCHALRHTAATLMLEGGADLRSIQTLLGHQRLNTTQIYTHITIKHLREVHAKTHPGARDLQPGERSSSDDK
jgi:integrase/recombinase XerD